MAEEKKKEPEVLNALVIKLMDDGTFKYESDPAVPNWALSTFVQLFLAALQSPKEG